MRLTHEQKEEIVRWHVLPENYRQAEDLNELAFQLGVDVLQVKRFIRTDQFRQMMDEQVADIVYTEVPDVIRVWIESAKMPGREGFQDRKLFLETFGVERLREVFKKVSSEMGEAELISTLEALRKEIGGN